MLPLFPLSLVVFPGEQFRLHIFEPRYKQLIRECASEGIRFGIPPVVQNDLKRIGTLVELVSIDRRHPGGEMDITTRGVSRLGIGEFYREMPGKPYPGGEAEDLSESEAYPPSLLDEVLKLLAQVHDAAGIKPRAEIAFDHAPSFQLGHMAGFEIGQEYELLATSSEEARLQMLKSHLSALLPKVLEVQRLRTRARLNGHYKNLLPPEY
jgi:hypothetical protein